MDLETEINQIRDNYPEHSINIEYNYEHGYWALAVSKTGESTRTTLLPSAVAGNR